MIGLKNSAFTYIYSINVFFHTSITACSIIDRSYWLLDYVVAIFIQFSFIGNLAIIGLDDEEVFRKLGTI